MTDTSLVTIRSAELSVVASQNGAELHAITDKAGGEWLWDGDPRWWAGQAPILFPTVGMLVDDTARFGGKPYPMTKHGFARRSHFARIALTDDSVTYLLTDTPLSLEWYPFAYRLEITHSVSGPTLTSAATVTNTGDQPLPVGFGFHPALRWPLPGTAADSRFDHIIRFDSNEPEPLRAITPEGLFAKTPRSTPVRGNEIELHDDLFTDDALVWDKINSQGLFFGVPGSPAVRVDFSGMPMLGIWTKPGAGYLCIEPWHSHADEEGFAGEFADKPGVITLQPGESHDYRMAMTFGVTL
jgi:galactose mutarotase-like enzyme